MYSVIYADNTPEILDRLALTPALQRLEDISMHCGCDWASFPIYKTAGGKYSRLVHSIGVSKIVWNFTHDIVQAVSGLFHDISTPVFAHSIDFLNGDYMEQESTENETAAFICSSKEIMAILGEYDIQVAAVSDYHCYPIADNDTPMLSADRLEYTLGNGYFLNHMSIKQLSNLYNDLTVVKNESGIDELAFRTLKHAVRFTELSLRNSHMFVSDEERFAMQCVADIVHYALQTDVLCREDLNTTEAAVIEKLKKDPDTAELWRRYTSVSQVQTDKERNLDAYCVNIAAKKRYINPLVATDKGIIRTSEADQGIHKKMCGFLELDFDKWLYAE